MKIKNNDITMVRGETATLRYIGICKDGTPYILTPATNISLDLTKRYDYAIVAFTIKTSAYGETVLAKYFDLEAAPMYDGITDETPGGFHKFSTQEITPVTQVSEIESTTKVYAMTENRETVYYTRLSTNDIKPYQFEFAIPLVWNELSCLESKEYIYALTLYYGQLTDKEIQLMTDVLVPSSNDFPLIEDSNLVKVPLITRHKFIVEDSNNV